MLVKTRLVKQQLKADAELPLSVVVGGTEELLVVDGNDVEGTVDVLNPSRSSACGCRPCSDLPMPNAAVDGVGRSEVEDVLGAAISVK